VSRTWTLVNPATGQPFLDVPLTAPSDLDGILTRAHAAQARWRRTPVAERVRIVEQLVQAFRAQADRVGSSPST
jgi:acyl-CoA reductase-like NAD-dependent aldehyde dehydrogenase